MIVRDQVWYDERMEEMFSNLSLFNQMVQFMDKELHKSTKDALRDTINKFGMVHWANQLNLWCDAMGGALSNNFGRLGLSYPMEEYVVPLVEFLLGFRGHSQGSSPAPSLDSIRVSNNPVPSVAASVEFEESMPEHRVSIYGYDRAVELLMERIENSIRAANKEPEDYALEVINEGYQVRLVAKKVRSTKQRVGQDELQQWVSDTNSKIKASGSWGPSVVDSIAAHPKKKLIPSPGVLDQIFPNPNPQHYDHAPAGATYHGDSPLDHMPHNDYKPSVDNSGQVQGYFGSWSDEQD